MAQSLGHPVAKRQGHILLGHSNSESARTGRPEALRNMYGHWTQEVRRSRQGLALRPHVEVDGDLWQVALRRATRFPDGRGYLVHDGQAELCQAARP